MGSKLDDVPVVSLCRDRCAYLDEAIRQRYAFADAHLAYLHALKSVGLSLDRYFNSHFSDTIDNNNDNNSSSPPAPYDGVFLSLPGETAGSASSSKAPPLPPSLSRSSGWDFFNPFESFEKLYPPYTLSRDPREVREEEGIPDLEEDGNDVVKEIHGNQKFVDSGSSSYSKLGVSGGAELQHNRARLSVGMESGPVEYEVHMADKKAFDSEVRLNGRDNAAGCGEFKCNLEVVREIQIQFERASECGMKLAKFFDVGKLPCEGNHCGHHASSEIFHFPVLSTSHPSTTKSSDNTDPGAVDVNEDVELRFRNLSSTLHKLYLWEKKLHEEVKVEEKMRVLHERKYQKLKCLDERGADFHKVKHNRNFCREPFNKD